MAVELKNEGNTLFAAGDYDGAAAKFTEAIAADATYHVAYSNRAAVFLQQGKYEEALADAEQVITIKGDWPKGYVRKVKALRALKRFEDAQAAVEAGLAAVPGDATLEAAKAEVEQDMAAASNPMNAMFGDEMWGKLAMNPTTRAWLQDESFAAMMRNVQANPQSMNMYLQDPRFQQALSVILGINFAAPGGADADGADADGAPTPTPSSAPSPAPAPATAAATAAEEEIEAEPVDPNKARAAEIKAEGNEHYKRKELDEALAKYREAQSLDPDEPTYYLNEAAVLFMQKEFDGCVARCEEALQHGGSFQTRAKAYVRIGDAHAARKDYDAALKAYKTAQTEDRTAATLKKINKTKKLRKKAVSEAYYNPELAEEAKELGNEACRASNYPKAVEHFEEAIKRDPNNHKYYSNLALALTKLGAYQDALKACEKCISIDPTFVRAYLRRGQIELICKDFHKAIDSYSTALELEPENAAAQQGLMKVEQGVQERERTAHENPEEVERARERALTDPGIKAIMGDPMVQNVLQSLGSDPRAAQDLMKDPAMYRKILKLRAAGVIRFG